MGTPRRRILATLLLLLLIATSTPAGDAAAARTLLEGGHKAFKARKYEESAALFQKAWTEDPSLVEALYWKGQSQEKLKDEPSALATYRQFLALARAKEGEGLSSEEKKVRDLARKRVDALAVAEREFKALEDRYVAALAALMKARVERGDAEGAVQVADRILEVSPEHAGAREVKERDAPDRGADPFSGVLDWKDLIASEGFRGPTTFAGGVMTMDVKGGGRLRTNPVVRFEAGFGYQSELRAAATYEETWSVGLAFGDEGETYMELRLSRAKIEFRRATPPKGAETFASVAMAAVDPSDWHSLGVLSRDGTVEGWLDGKQVIKVALPAGVTTVGDIGLVQQGCRVEHRLLRAGRHP